MDYKRIFIEKKKEFNIEGERLYKEFKEYLGTDSLMDVRVVNVYDLINTNIEDTEQIVEKNLI